MHHWIEIKESENKCLSSLGTELSVSKITSSLEFHHMNTTFFDCYIGRAIVLCFKTIIIISIFAQKKHGANFSINSSSYIKYFVLIAAEFMFDRSTRQPQMSAFFNEENNIAEEDELHMDGSCRDSENYQTPGLNEEDEARLRSCLDEIRNVIGDTVPEHILIDTVIKNEFNFNKSLDAVLSNNFAQNLAGNLI